MKKSFASDNNSPIHPAVLEAIVNANMGHYVSYGDDPHTAEALAVFKETFGEQTETFFVLTGTGANVSALGSLTDRFEAVLCPETAHINVDECGAVEHILGSKMITIPTEEGKLLPRHIEKYFHYQGNQHHTQPRVVSISQPTELGTVYTIEELKELIQLAHQHDLYVHIDGARLANAAVTLDCSLKALTTDLGVDAVSFGGTKNGLMIGEAVILLDKQTARHFPYIRKQNGQLLSKMRYISAQFIPFLRDNLWKQTAKQANDMALYLYERLCQVAPGIITAPPQSNALLVYIPKEIAHIMQSERFFYTWDDVDDIYRFMTSWDMTKEDIDDFVEFIREKMVV